MFPTDSKIMVIDDMPSLRDVIKKTLNNMGYFHIIAAGDGQEAYQFLVAQKVKPGELQLVICDWNMPNMTGLDLLRVIRAYSEWKDLPFIMLTTENEKSKVIEAIQVGASNYMIKPVNEKTLTEKMKSVWAQAQKKKAGA